MTHKRLPKAVLFALAAACVLTACSGEPAPFEASTPSPVASQGGQYLGFDTEEEAIAAAEEVYASYIEEVNRLWAGDTQANPTEMLMGKAYELEIEVAALVESQGLTLEGETSSEVLEATLASPEQAILTVCQSVKGRVIDSSGQDVTPKDRPQKQALQVSVERDGDGALRVANSGSVSDSRCS